MTKLNKNCLLLSPQPSSKIMSDGSLTVFSLTTTTNAYPPRMGTAWY
nr:MAG TPA: hypothetical protein [Caudoviricetes sp.]